MTASIGADIPANTPLKAVPIDCIATIAPPIELATVPNTTRSPPKATPTAPTTPITARNLGLSLPTQSRSLLPTSSSFDIQGINSLPTEIAIS